MRLGRQILKIVAALTAAWLIPGAGLAARIDSPRIAALDRALARGNEGAAAAFWTRVASEGAPLVERIPGDPRHVRLTFLHRGDAETRNALIWSDLGDWGDLASLRLTRLRGSDIWYRTWRIRDDARFAYRISVNDSLLPFGSPARAAAPTPLRDDPLNPRRYELLRPTIYSVVGLPRAPSLALTERRDGVPRSTGGRTDFASDALGGTRRVWIYTPPGYRAEAGPYDLLILFDGSGYVTMIPAPVVLDNLLAQGRIRPTVAVLVDSGAGEARERDLSCGEPFVRFVTTELLPWIRAHYRVHRDPAHVVVGGASFGGLAASCMALRHPELFGNVLSQAGSYWWSPAGERAEWLTRRYAAAPRAPIRFYLEAGLMEDRSRARPGGPTNFAANRNFRALLARRGYDVRFEAVNGGHDFFAWQASLGPGLEHLLGTRRPPR